MSQVTITPISVPAFPPLTYKEIPVLTSGMLAQAYEVDPKQIRQNFSNNSERFIEGKHYFSIAGEELKTFRLCVENFDAQISPKARTLTLWTERGAARHAKMLNSDKAWDVFELLEETFFAVARKEGNPSPQTAGPDAPIGPSDQNTLQAIVRAKVAQMPEASSRGGFPQIWSRFNNHFRLGSYKQLPQSKMAEAVAYLVAMDVKPDNVPRVEALPSGDRYEAYILEVEAARERMGEEISRLMDKGIALVDHRKFGPGCIVPFTHSLGDWLRIVLTQPSPIVGGWYKADRALNYSPVGIFQKMEKDYEWCRGKGK